MSRLTTQSRRPGYLEGSHRSGKISPFIDQSYPLSETPAAIRHLESRQVQGKVAIHV
ncbi:MAG: zinc-binding dehydrogenase [Cyanobacteria bacterium P01_A01_bin.17]